MILVAIPNTNRNRDMTPGPGAATFQRVLAEELIPWVERNFRAASERILVGHSLSASFAVHTLLNRPELFDAYVAASAPLWRYEGLAADISAGLPRAAKARAAVYLTVGERENERLRDGMHRFVLRAEQDRVSQLIDLADSFVAGLLICIPFTRSPEQKGRLGWQDYGFRFRALVKAVLMSALFVVPGAAVVAWVA